MEYGYQMSETRFKAILATRNKQQQKINPYEFVIDVLNKEENFKHHISRLSVIPNV